MIRVVVRRSGDVTYLTDDPALELDSVRAGSARWEPFGDDRRVEGATLEPRRAGAVVGYDLIIAAPRPASILLAVGDERERAGVVTAHRRGVADALSYLDERAVVVRRQILGDVERVRARVATASAFTHGVNRSLEPHLHDHVVISAHAAGSTRVLESRSIFAHVRAADALYRASLRQGIEELSGRCSWRSRAGVEYVEGIDEGLRALWPGRASERAAKSHPTRGEIVAKWQRDLADYEPVVVIAPPRRNAEPVDRYALAKGLVERDRVERRDLVASLADATTFGATAGSITAAIERTRPPSDVGRGLDEWSITVRDALARDLTIEPPELALDRQRESWSRVRSLESTSRSR